MNKQAVPTIARRARRTALAVGLGLTLTLGGGAAALAAPAQASAATGQSASADAIIATGKQYLGTRYQFGAEAGITSAFDCSSFTQYIYGRHGVELPRSSRQQASAGTAIARSQLRAGDLVFSDTNRDGVINHVSVYIGNDQLLHTYRVGIGVTVSDFSGSTWDETYVTARRVLSDSALEAQQVEDESEADQTTASDQSEQTGSEELSNVPSGTDWSGREQWTSDNRVTNVKPERNRNSWRTGGPSAWR
ncbi:C40 family peptidase [Paenibacillus sp. IB182496]|uniref:C40 family peptidase n=1 Tax=Paenibacillus sabuli TaxID=2772509 RepID=A0A927BRQ8_9BACL|nr:C40 family peptidase [Paenibacillus sabuli]MBD2845077.1 C40 family peptidase [Paenibacillus sabuli]